MSVTSYDILNTILDNASDLYISRVPEATRNNLKQVGDAITSDSNIMNEFITTLVNKIVYSNVVSKMFINPLAKLKKSNARPYGSTIEEIFINPATDVGYDNDGNKLLKTTKPDGKTAYYGLNRKSSYPVSIDKEVLLRAFQSDSEFMSMYEGIVSSLYSGDNIDEFNLMKGLFGKAIDEGAMKVIESDLASPKDLAKTISKNSQLFAFPNTEYNGYNLVNATKISSGETKCITYCDVKDQVLLVRADVQTEIDYEVLASYFHIDKLKLQQMTIPVDYFPSTKYDVYAVLCDQNAIQVRDTTFEIATQYIGSSLKWNFWLHHWQFLFLSMFGNCLAFAKTKATV